MAKHKWIVLLWAVGAAMTTLTPALSGDSTAGDLRAITRTLTEETLFDHENNPVVEKTRDLIIKILQEHGFKGAVEGSFRQVYPDGVNLLALWGAAEGAEPVKVLVGAHYDRIHKNCRPHDQARSANCNAATDNVAGVAAAISAVKMAGVSLKAPVLLALWDGEERGLTGSAYFALHPTIEQGDLTLSLNIDTVGSNLFAGLESTHMVIGTETGGQDLAQAVRHEARDLPLNIKTLSYAFGHRRCDITSFVKAGWRVPFLFFSDGDGSVYHSAADEYQRVDFDKLHAITRLVSNLIRHGDRLEKAYPYHSFPIIQDRVPPLFSDVAILHDLMQQAVESADSNRLDDQQTQRLEHALSLVETILKGGSASFDQGQMSQLVFAAREFVKVSRLRPLEP